MPIQQSITYQDWLKRFRQLAVENSLEWIISEEPEAYRTAYERGTSPEEELNTLADLAEWRGCGCGGG